jgi:large subunit ribosomal protein L2
LQKFYNFYTQGIKIGQNLKYLQESLKPKNGDILFLKNIPLGSLFHSFTNFQSKKNTFGRAAGTSCKLLSKDFNKNTALIKLPSKITKKVPLNSIGTLGVISNIFHRNKVLGSAGRSRWLGRRPHTRGVAMNPVDHPHGGGEGKGFVGRPSVTPWGRITKGQPTRRRKQY